MSNQWLDINVAKLVKFKSQQKPKSIIKNDSLWLALESHLFIYQISYAEQFINIYNGLAIMAMGSLFLSWRLCCSPDSSSSNQLNPQVQEALDFDKVLNIFEPMKIKYSYLKIGYSVPNIWINTESLPNIYQIFAEYPPNS